jgi:hypothetical protein
VSEINIEIPATKKKKWENDSINSLRNYCTAQQLVLRKNLGESLTILEKKQEELFCITFTFTIIDVL